MGSFLNDCRFLDQVIVCEVFPSEHFPALAGIEASQKFCQQMNANLHEELGWIYTRRREGYSRSLTEAHKLLAAWITSREKTMKSLKEAVCIFWIAEGFNNSIQESFLSAMMVGSLLVVSLPL